MSKFKPSNIISEEDFDNVIELFVQIEKIALKYMSRIDANYLVNEMIKILRKTVIESKHLEGENE